MQLYGENARPCVESLLTSVSGFSEGAEPARELRALPNLGAFSGLIAAPQDTRKFQAPPLKKDRKYQKLTWKSTTYARLYPHDFVVSIAQEQDNAHFPLWVALPAHLA
jgi:hypothetical protein